MCLLGYCSGCQRADYEEHGHAPGCPVAERLAQMHETPDYANAPIELDLDEEE